MTNQKKRVPYYDVMKGILICLVALSHINYESLEVFNIQNDTISWLRSYQWIFVSFYMPAFFVITGICSNFNKPAIPFVINNLKTLLLPGIVFDILTFAIPNMIMTGDVMNESLCFVRRIISLGGYYWFLVALFLSKNIYWLLNRYLSSATRWASLIILFVLAYILKNNNFCYNHWAIFQTFDLTIFLAIGQFLKTTTWNMNKIYRYGLLCFSCIVILFLFTKWKMPYIAATYNVSNWYEMPVHLLTATTGTIALLYGCKKIGNNTLLEYLGTTSLVIYMVHSLFIKIILTVFGTQLDNASFVTSIISVIVIFVIVIALSALIAWCFQQKYLRVLIGKKN